MGTYCAYCTTVTVHCTLYSVCTCILCEVMLLPYFVCVVYLVFVPQPPCAGLMMTPIILSLFPLCRLLLLARCTRIGNALGAGDPHGAELSTWTTTLLGFSVSLLASVTLLSVRHSWGEKTDLTSSYIRATLERYTNPSLSLPLCTCVCCVHSFLACHGDRSIGRLFTEDGEVVALVSDLLLPLAVYVIADGTQCGLSGVIKGAGMQGVGGPVVLFSYYIVGLPAAVYMAFDLNGRGLGLGVTGLCLGTAIGTWVHMLIFLVITRRVDWKEEARMARQKLGLQIGGGSDESVYLPLKAKEKEEEEKEDDAIEMGEVHMNVVSLYDGQDLSWASQ